MTTSIVWLEDAQDQQRENSVARSSTLEPDVGDGNEDVRDGAVIIDLTSEMTFPPPDRFLHSAVLQSQLSHVHVGDVLEIRDTMLGQYPVHFIKVTGISHESMGGQTFEGLPFIRTRNMQGLLPKKRNEVCMMLHFRRQSRALLDDQPALASVKAELVVRRRSLITTNSLYPKFAVRRRSQPSANLTTGQFAQPEEDTTLVCRWKWMVGFVEKNRQIRIDEEAIERINEEEVSGSQFMVSEQTLSNRWRGDRRRGGSWPDNHQESVIQCDDGCSTRRPLPFRHHGQRYTLFDAFSGARGVSRGAQSAGFRVSHAVDRDPAVWDTYSANFPDTCLHRMSVDQFIQETDDVSPRPDVLHMSPPCQYFSPAHTRSCAHDEENTDAMLCCHALVRKLRPRLVTLEETFGLRFQQHQAYFHSLIGDLTHHGYSVRWKVVQLCTWGSAQTRKRLVVIAAGPGERLPPYPAASHSKDSSSHLLPYTTIRKALSKIKPDDDLHHLAAVTHFNPPRPRLDFDTQIGTIVTSPGTIYYPDGTRSYTVREYACLQGFPISHQFRGTRTSMKRQIGNAFPPNTVKLLYKHLEQWLLKQDGIADYKPPSTELITLDEEATNDFIGYSSTAALIREGGVARAYLSNSRSLVDHDCVLVDLT
uniref:DNA (cytosine-5-)-methyltransferase n=1 Tax=Aciculosporium take TaxID=42363 RepID=M1PEP4_9HYPO|nr:DmtA [Aciculosporium take]